MTRVRFVMIGGFLGAGKTTTIARLARHFADQGLKVGIVTNDQAFNLVDTQALRSQGFDVGEVMGACFCCKFDDLVQTAEQLRADQQPDIILAEPVGSCTDLVATVAEPLQHLYGEQYDLAPFAVLLKPEHGQKILGDRQVGFSHKAAYIFLKQIEEADVVVLNKIDKLSPDERDALIALVRERYPSKQVVTLSARTGEGLEKLIDVVNRPHPQRTSTPEVDYDIYAEGEAELGWLNCTVALRTARGGEKIELDAVTQELVERLARVCLDHDAEPAHLKILGQADGETAIANLVGAGVAVELSCESAARCTAAELTINARVAVAPETLSEWVEQCTAELASAHGLDYELTNLQSFRPGRPVPTHRMKIG